MRTLQIEKLKSLILDEEEFIRDHATKYFHHGWIQDSEITHLGLSACERYGYENSTLLLSHLSRQPVDDESLATLLQKIRTTEDPTTLFHLNRLVERAPLEALETHASELGGNPRIDERTHETIRLRKEFAEQTSRRLYWRLLDFCREQRGDELTRSDQLFADTLVGSLGERDYPTDEELIHTLKTADYNDYWVALYLIELAGARKTSRAVPTLVDFLGDEVDSPDLSCIDALARIGDPEAVRLIGESFLSEDWYFQISAAMVLEYLKHPESEKVILRFRDVEFEESETAVHLCVALCRQLSPAAVEWARELIQSREAKGYTDLREDLIVLHRIHDLDLPEARQWHEEIAAKRALQQEMLGDISLDPSILRDPGSVDDPEAEDDIDESDFEEDAFAENSEDESSDYAPFETYQRPEPKIGRNAPCPCGSGKKYKKCCGRPGA